MKTGLINGYNESLNAGTLPTIAVKNVDSSSAKDPIAKSIVIKRVANDLALKNEMVHEFGLRRATSEADVPVLCCLVRDGAYWLPAFLDHYRALGVREFFFLDNAKQFSL